MKDKIKNHFSGNYKAFFDRYLKGVKKINGQEYQALCPFHDDVNPSLSFNGQTGLFFCHACDAKGDTFSFYGKKNGVTDFKKIIAGISADFGIAGGQLKPKIVKTYDYATRDGELLFQVCRMEPKSFRQRRSDGNGGWVWNLEGIEPVLYKLPKISEANEVWVVEGEKDADSLISLGFTATTSPMGAGKWCDKYGDELKGKDIILVPDNDDMGREHMAKVARSLNGNARSLKLLELPGLPNKGDVSDFIERFANKAEAAERLSTMVEQTKQEVAEILGVGTQAVERPTTKDAWDYVTHDEIYIQNPEVRPIIEGLLYEGEPTIIYAEGGVGKSLLIQDIVMHLAADKNSLWGKFSIPKHKTTLFIQSENAWAVINQRNHLKSSGDPDLKAGFQDVFYPQIHGGIQAAGSVTDEAFRKKIYALVQKIETENQCKIDIIVFDPLISFHDSEENDNSGMRTTLDFISEIAARIKATPMVLHHANKQGGIRAASAIRDWARNVIKLTDDTYQGQKRIKVENEKCNNHSAFEPFVLVMDENLNFEATEIDTPVSDKSKERGLLVREALEVCGGSVETRADLVDQYREMSGIKAESTICNHIAEASKNDYISKKYYKTGEGNFKKCRFFIGENC